MKAAILASPAPISERPLQIVDVADPRIRSGHVLLKVRACGVCRTDLHIVEGELPAKQVRLIPGHQIVGEIIDGATPDLPLGVRVGVSWLGGTDGTCFYCQKGMENLCDSPTFTGYTTGGGYAQVAFARSDFVFPLPDALDDLHAAPLLCAGIIGFRSLRVAGVERGERVGLFGYGSSATLTLDVLRAWGCEVYVVSRNEARRQAAREAGATWVGDLDSKPPVPLDRAVTFAPVGSVVISALASLRKGGVVAINAIHLDQMPAFNYDMLLWGERQLRSVANLTRQDARDFLALAREIGLHPPVTTFPLHEANRALAAVKHETERGSAVIVL